MNEKHMDDEGQEWETRRHEDGMYYDYAVPKEIPLKPDSKPYLARSKRKPADTIIYKGKNN